MADQHQAPFVTIKCEIEADKSGRGKGFRSKCGFPAPNPAEGSHFNKHVLVISVIGPWRPTHTEAESDEQVMNQAFHSGGVTAAQAAKNELRHQAKNSAITAAAKHDKLSTDEMADRYGKGFILAQRMGFSGAGLGRREQGRELLVSIDGCRPSVGSAARRGIGDDGREERDPEGGDTMGLDAGSGGSLGSSTSALTTGIAFQKADTLQPEQWPAEITRAGDDGHRDDDEEQDEDEEQHSNKENDARKWAFPGGCCGGSHIDSAFAVGTVGGRPSLADLGPRRVKPQLRPATAAMVMVAPSPRPRSEAPLFTGVHTIPTNAGHQQQTRGITVRPPQHLRPQQPPLWRPRGLASQPRPAGALPPLSNPRVARCVSTSLPRWRQPS